MSPRPWVAAHNLRVDHSTAQVLRAFADAAVPSILLKGPTTSRWLHPDEPRPYQDTDVLVPPAAVETAERVLREAGFTPQVDRLQMPVWWREHAVEWTAPGRYAAVDLHHGLKGVDVDGQRLWEVLQRETEPMEIGGFEARVLTRPGRVVVLAIDRLGETAAKRDLERAIEVADDVVWTRAVELARDLGVTTTFTAGLRLAPGGASLAERLGLPTGATIEETLRAQRAAPGALTLERLARASTMRERWSIVRYKLLPPPTFMRRWSIRARAGRRALIRAYGARVVWIVRRLPRALRTTRQARREAQAERSVET